MAKMGKVICKCLPEEHLKAYYCNITRMAWKNTGTNHGYCTDHGYGWCKCLQSMDELDNLLSEGLTYIYAKQTSKGIKTDCTPTIRSKSARNKRP